jgi:hypothetical protein
VATTTDDPEDSSDQPAAQPDGRGDPASAEPVPEELRREFQELGLSPYEARLLLAMLQLGQANTLQLAYRVPTEGPAVWACVSRDEILQRLDAAERERLRQHRARSERGHSLLDQHIPQQPPVVRPPLRLLHTTAEQYVAYRRLARQTQHEALLATPLPDGTQDNDGDGDQLDPVLADLAGRVETRVLYGADESDPAEDSAAVATLHACQQAGAYARTVADLPLQWAIFDRRAALVTLATRPRRRRRPHRGPHRTPGLRRGVDRGAQILLGRRRPLCLPRPLAVSADH